MRGFTNRCAVVTGAAQGIGYAIAKRLVEEGVKALAIVDWNGENAEKAAAELQTMGQTTVKAYKCDVDSYENAEETFSRIEAELGPVDILVNNAGIARDVIFHKMTPEQWDTVMRANLYGVFNCCRVVINGMRQREYGRIINMSSTSAGTPVDITRTMAEADFRICLGNIEYHYFAGYFGGSKAIMPGVSTRDAIQSNHSMMIRPEACAGNLETNPVRKDIEEAADICGIDFILNVVLGEHKEILKAVAGHPIEAHREGCKFLDTIYLKELSCGADIVLVSQGGAPKDLNLYQTQKALDNARHAVREGGTIILIGSCREGLGERVFEEWMTTSPSPESMIERIAVDFQRGGHKAAAIAMTLKKAEIVLISELEDEFVRALFLTPAASAQEALDRAFERLGANATVLAMPFGGSTLPKIV